MGGIIAKQKRDQTITASRIVFSRLLWDTIYRKL